VCPTRKNTTKRVVYVGEKTGKWRREGGEVVFSSRGRKKRLFLRGLGALGALFASIVRLFTKKYLHSLQLL